jgi:hypothetical protein
MEPQTVSLIKTVLDKLKASQPPPQSKDQSSWFIGLAISFLVCLGAAILAWYLSSKSSELAKLQHEKAVAEENQQQAAAKAKLTVLDEERKRLEIQALSKLEQSVALDVKIKQIEAGRTKLQQQIKELTDWDSIDKFVKENK